MVNLDNIHFRFFPKAKTAPWGKKLIIMAWAIEIMVASVSFMIAMLFFLSKGQSDLKLAEAANDLDINSIIVGLSFLVVTLIELTKIPLASVSNNQVYMNIHILKKQFSFIKRFLA